jgi:hypothetical protein
MYRKRNIKDLENYQGQEMLAEKAKRTSQRSRGLE